MSRYTSYIGSYMRVPGVLKETGDRNYSCSASCGAAVPSGAKFCANCGAFVTGPTLKTRLTKLSHNDIEDKFTDDLHSPEYCGDLPESESIWLENKSRIGHRLRDDQAPLSLADNDSQKDIAAFQARYKSVIESIESTFNVKVSFDWGAVVYA